MTPPLVVHVFWQCPFRPWTATMLGLSQSCRTSDEAAGTNTRRPVQCPELPLASRVQRQQLALLTARTRGILKEPTQALERIAQKPLGMRTFVLLFFERKLKSCRIASSQTRPRSVWYGMQGVQQHCAPGLSRGCDVYWVLHGGGWGDVGLLVSLAARCSARSAWSFLMNDAATGRPCFWCSSQSLTCP